MYVCISPALPAGARAGGRRGPPTPRNASSRRIFFFWGTGFAHTPLRGFGSMLFCGTGFGHTPVRVHLQGYLESYASIIFGRVVCAR